MSQSKGTLLVVEDQPGLLKLYEVMLQEDGYLVHTAEDGSEAMACFNLCHEDLDVVIMDYHLPGITGLDVYRMMLETRPGLRMVLCSGAPESTLIDRLEPEWPIKLLFKPFTTKQLLSAVADLKK